MALMFAAALGGEASQESAAPALPPIGQLADGGVETYRVEFERLTGLAYPDRLGAAASKPTVIFERRPGEAPRVIVLAADRRMEGPVSEVAWERVRREGRALADAVGPRNHFPDADEVCVGAMLFTTVEMTPDWIRGSDGTPWRRWTSLPGCGDTDGPVAGFGDDMARIALDLLPPCDSLTTATDPNPSRTLAQCVWLDGDRMAAVQFLNDRRLRPRRTYVAARDWRDWRDWFGQGEPELEWPGYVQWLEQAQDGLREGREHSDQSVFVAEQAGQLENLSIWYTSIRGDSAGQVTTRGFITGVRPEGPGGDDDIDVIAVDEQVWEHADGWSLRSWRVEPFHPQDENGQ